MDTFKNFSEWICFIQLQEKKTCKKLFEEILNKYTSYTPKNNQQISLLRKAFEFGKYIHRNQKRDSGVPYFTHPLIVTSLLLYYKADYKLLIASLLHDTIEDSEAKDTDKKIKDLFGEEIYSLIDGVSKVSKKIKSQSHQETLKKIFSHSAYDARILIIKIADRIHNITTIGTKLGEKKRQKKIEETLNVFVLATEKLQLEYFKNLLLNSCSYYLFPKKFLKIEKEVKEKTPKAKQLFKKISEEIHKIHTQALIEYKEYCISSLLERGDADIYDLKPSDLFYIDIITSSKDECYQALSWLSKIYNHKTSLLNDFIANPPENGYQALKTSMIVDSSFLVRFHILTRNMKIKNDKGIFFKIEKGEKTLPFFSLSIADDSKNFVEILTHDILAPKKCVHNPEKGIKYIPIHANALDTVIHLFPKKFIYIKNIFREGECLELSCEINNNDILECEFSNKIQANVLWIKYLKSNFGKTQLQNFLKKEEESIKEHSGEKMLQQSFDIFKEGEISSILDKFPEIYKSFFAKSKKELFVFIAEGMISTQEVLIKYEEIKSQKKSFFQKVKNYCSSFFSEKIKNTMKIYISSKTLSKGELIQMVSKYALKKNILPEKIEIKKSKTNSLYVTASANNKKNLFDFFSILKLRKEIFSVSFIPSFRFYFHIFLLAGFPIFIGIFLFLIFPFSYFTSHTFFYIFVLMLVLSNTWAYLIFSKFFLSWRNKKIRIFALIFINTLIIIFYSLYYNLINPTQISFFIPLLLIIASSLFSIILLKRQVVDIHTQNSLPHISDWEKHKMEKRKGFFLRGISILCFGLMPVIGKYFFTNIGGIFVMSLSYGLAFMLLLPLMVHHMLFLKKEEDSRGYHWTFWVVIVFDALMLLFWFLSVESISASQAALFLNFAPVLAIIISIFLFKKTSSYMQDKKSFYKILLAFPLGSIGASLIIFQESNIFVSKGYIGDIFAVLMMLSDVIATIALVHYAKMKGAFSALGFVLRKIFFLGIVFVPLSFYYILGDFQPLTSKNIYGIFILSIAIFLAYWTAFESFKRIDGFISYLFLNFSPVISILLEVIFFNFSINIYFFIGAALIIGASLWAESVNDTCEKEFALKQKNF